MRGPEAIDVDLSAGEGKEVEVDRRNGRMNGASKEKRVLRLLEAGALNLLSVER